MSTGGGQEGGYFLFAFDRIAERAVDVADLTVEEDLVVLDAGCDVVGLEEETGCPGLECGEDWRRSVIISEEIGWAAGEVKHLWCPSDEDNIAHLGVVDRLFGAFLFFIFCAPVLRGERGCCG